MAHVSAYVYVSLCIGIIWWEYIRIYDHDCQYNQSLEEFCNTANGKWEWNVGSLSMQDLLLGRL